MNPDTPQTAEQKAPVFQDVVKAGERIRENAIHTPLIRNDWLNDLLLAEVFFKPENLQVTGSFKFRGAFNALSALPESIRQQGVVACSSGNHAQGVAEAARRFGVPATIVMPQDSPATKVARTRRSGADVVLYDRVKEDRDAIAKAICEEKGASFIHPFENPFVIAGQGTSGLEIADDLAEKGTSLDHMIICCGGGGLTAGITLALVEKMPGCKIHTAEPEGFDDYALSLEAGKRLSNEALSGSVCDAIVTPSPGEISFGICHDRLSQGLVVNDEMALAAVRLAHEELKLTVEPGGAAAFAALLANREKFRGKRVGVILSGGNIDADILGRALATPLDFML